MLVSIIIPTYNRATTIVRAVNSALGQTWEHREVIVVDDGSADATVEVLAQYGDRIKVICQPNQGPSAARNRGIEAAKGEIISFLDSDDEWLPEKTECQMKLFEASGADVKCCVCNARMEYPDGVRTSFARVGLHPEHPEGIWLNPAEVLVEHSMFFNQVMAVRREVFQGNGGFRADLRVMEDYDLALRLSLLGPWAFTAAPLAVWHGYEENSLSQNVTELDGAIKEYAILKSLWDSSEFGPRMPGLQVRRRLRRLRWWLGALRLSAQANPGISSFGRMSVWALRGSEALYRRLPTSPRMLTRPISVGHAGRSALLLHAIRGK